jgi:microcystin-dependent protein
MTDTLSPASFIPAGTIIPYLGGAQSSPPLGWLFCNGNYVSKDTYGDLFAAIAYTYGQSGTNFRLPASDRFFKGSATGASGGAGGGSSTHSHGFSFSTSGNLSNEASHGHNVNAPATTDPTDATHSHGDNNYYFSSTNASNNTLTSGSANLLAGDTHSHLVNLAFANASGSHQHGGIAGSVGAGNIHSHTHSASSSNLSSNNVSSLPPYYYLCHIIKT